MPLSTAAGVLSVGTAGGRTVFPRLGLRPHGRPASVEFSDEPGAVAEWLQWLACSPDEVGVVLGADVDIVIKRAIECQTRARTGHLGACHALVSVVNPLISAFIDAFLAQSSTTHRRPIRVRWAFPHRAPAWSASSASRRDSWVIDAMVPIIGAVQSHHRIAKTGQKTARY